MPLHVEWYLPYRVIDARFSGHVTASDIQLQVRLFVQFLSESKLMAPDKLVYLLFDTLQAESMPPFYRTLNQALPILKFKNRGPAFHVTRNSRIRHMIDLAAHVARFEVYSFSGREDAIRAIEEYLGRENSPIQP